MAITRDDIAANADEILRELQQTGIDYSEPMGGRPRPRPVDIIAALEANPRLTLADVLPPDPSPAETLSGREGEPPQGSRPFPDMMSIPSLPPPNAIPPGQALRPNTREEAAQLGQDARSFGMAAEATGAPAAWRAGRAATRGDPIGAVGNAAVALMPYKPLAGIGTLGAAYGGAVASDLAEGFFGSFGAQAQQQNRGRPAPLPQLPGLDAAQQAELNRLELRIRNQDYNSGSERRQIEAAAKAIRDTSTNFQNNRNTATVQAEAERARQEQREYNQAVQRAEAARDAELARHRRFENTRTGQLFEQTGGFAPFAIAAPLGGLSRAATGGGSRLNNYGIPMASGASAGFSAAHVPLGYNAFFTPSDNPDRRAYEAYGRELPPNHPRRQEWIDYARGLPEQNPLRREAAAELYDPLRFAERTALGVVEGALGGLAGSELVRTPGRLLDWFRGRGRSTPPPAVPPSSTPPPSATPPAGDRLVDRMQASRETAGPPPPAPARGRATGDRPPDGAYFSPSENMWIINVPGQGRRWLAGRDRWPDHIPERRHWREYPDE